MLPIVTATLTDSLDVTVAPGTSIRFFVEIQNSGYTNASEVAFCITMDYNTTLVPGSVAATPVGSTDSYSATDGIELIIPDGAGDLLDNDFLGLPTAAVMTSFGGGSLGGSVTDFAPGDTAINPIGTLTVNADGSFSFTPTGPGIIAFYYRLTNSLGSADCQVVILVEALNSEANQSSTISTADKAFNCDCFGSQIEICIGTIPPGQTSKIVFGAVIDCPFPDGVSNVANQGLVLGLNFTDLLTDDPDDIFAHSPTVTLVDGDLPCETSDVNPAPEHWNFVLRPNAPNPFNPLTTIIYELPAPALVNLQVFNTAGRLVRVLKQNELQDSGRHDIPWNGRDELNNYLSSGIYFYVVEVDGVRQVGKMALIR